jgi:hypothetical protein
VLQDRKVIQFSMELLIQQHKALTVTSISTLHQVKSLDQRLLEYGLLVSTLLDLQEPLALSVPLDHKE